MNVLIDLDEAEAVAITNETDLIKAVDAYLVSTESLADKYFNDGKECLTTAQFLERPDLIRDAFKLEELPIVKADPGLTMEERGKLARDVWAKVFDECESFNEQEIGKDLAYLMGAILDDTGDTDCNVDWSDDVFPSNEKPEVLRILKEHFPQPDHPVWKFIIL